MANGNRSFGSSITRLVFYLTEHQQPAYTILAGMLAEEVLLACDENNAEASPHGSTSDLGLANPAVHFFRGLRHRNLNAIRHATQRGIHQLQQLHSHNNSDNIFLMKNRSSPLTIQGLRTNPKGKFIDFQWYDKFHILKSILNRFQTRKAIFFSSISRD